MFKIVGWRDVLVLCCLLTVGMSLLFFSGIFIPAVRAAGNPQVSITYPTVNGTAIGHAGTRVTITGSGFTDGIGSLYTTTSGDPTKCSDAGNPANLGLTPFSTHPKALIAGGNLQVQSTWPNNAANPGTQYYICVIKRGSSALSPNTFTVAQPATISVAQTTAAPGAQVTVTGMNWLPPQVLTVSIIGNNNQTIVNQSASPDPNGNLNVSLTIPASTQPGTYSVTAVAQNEATMNATASNALTVSTATATPSASPSPSPSVTTSPTVTPTLSVSPTAQNTGANDSGSNFDGGLSSSAILFILIGTAILLIIAGGILLIVYTRIQ